MQVAQMSLALLCRLKLLDESLYCSQARQNCRFSSLNSERRNAPNTETPAERRRRREKVSGAYLTMQHHIIRYKRTYTQRTLTQQSLRPYKHFTITNILPVAIKKTWHTPIIFTRAAFLQGCDPWLVFSLRYKHDRLLCTEDRLKLLTPHLQHATVHTSAAEDSTPHQRNTDKEAK